MSEDLLDRLRLIRTQGIGPIAFRQLLLRFGSAREALAAIPDLARRGGGKAPSLYPVAAAEREVAAVAALGARFLSIGQGLFLMLSRAGIGTEKRPAKIEAVNADFNFRRPRWEGGHRGRSIDRLHGRVLRR